MNNGSSIRLNLPVSDDDVRALHAGDTVLLSGTLVTGRDAAHKWLYDAFIQKTSPVDREDELIENELQKVLKDGAIYHCGPVVSRLPDGSYKFMAAGPTTSIREEGCQAEIIRQFGVKVVIGKGGMGERTLRACEEAPAVYLHATGGAAVIMADCVKEVLGVFKLEFGIPEAMWLIRVADMPLVVSMDAHGVSLHEKIRRASQQLI